MPSPSIIDVNDPTSVRNRKEESSSVRIDRASEDEGCDQPASSLRSEKAQPPENKLTLLAVKLALLEKTGNGIGSLNFIWATVVLLGGFAEKLESIDFWLVSIILMAEGVRLFARSSELETESASRCPSSLDSKKFLIRMNLFSIVIQDYFPLACVTLSIYRFATQDDIYRLATQDYGDDYPNRNRALNIFYGLSLAEEFMMLLVFSLRFTRGNYFFSLMNPAELSETSFSKFLGSFLKSLGSLMNKEYGFDESQVPTVRRFFSDAYSRCINGSISESLKMEFVSYGLDLLQSSHSDDRLEGARLLSACMKTNRFTAERLSQIGTMRGLLETLIEMLNWDELHEHEIRLVAAQIISKLVMTDRNLIRVLAIPESMESIASLLYDRNQIQIHSRHYGDQSSSFLHQSNQIEMQSRENGNQSTEEYPYSDFRLPGLQILTSLARKQEVRGIVGATGGVLHNLFSLFFMERNDNNDQTEEFVTKAGEALGFLSLENKQNCEIMISINLGDHPDLIKSLISVLNDSVQGTHAARILRNLLAYAEIDCDELKETTASAAEVVVSEMEKQGAHQEHQEAIIGLAAQIFKFMSKLDFDSVFQAKGAEIKTSLISKLLKVFKEHPHPSKEVPSIRRFSLELLIAVMKMDRSTIEMRSELEEVLERVMRTTSELESYSISSGTLGLSSHRMAIRSLVKSAKVLLRN